MVNPVRDVCGCAQLKRGVYTLNRRWEGEHKGLAWACVRYPFHLLYFMREAMTLGVLWFVCCLYGLKERWLNIGQSPLPKEKGLRDRQRRVHPQGEGGIPDFS